MTTELRTEHLLLRAFRTQTHVAAGNHCNLRPPFQTYNTLAICIPV